MNIQNQKGVRAVLVTEWNAVDLEEYAFGNITLVTQLINKCEDLHEIDAKDLGHALSASLEIINAVRLTKEQ
ncbi:hypothetical protein ACED34_13965 [Vibrio splendidus]|uniref:hypothetical protein n=1 Tax=Vibrio splendidus TaxID=29497 RepID=UPI00352D153C